MSINFKGAIHDLIGDFLSIKDGYTVGEKIEHLRKQLPAKKFYDSTDEEIFSTLEKTIKTDYYTDNEE